MAMSRIDLDGGVYLCAWTKARGIYKLSVVKRPELRAEAKDFAEAEELLVEAIHDEVGDMQPCLEYQEPPPKGVVQAKFEGPGIVSVGGSNDFLECVGELDGLFDGGLCPLCRHGIGARTDAPLVVEGFASGSDGAFVTIGQRGSWGRGRHQIFSAEFRAALDPQDAGRFEWIPVESKRKSKRKFFEPVSPPVAPHVLPAGLSPESKRIQPDGFSCGKCGRKQLAGIPKGGDGIFKFVSAQDLPAVLPGCFQTGLPADLDFTMTKEKWKTLVGQPGTKRLMSGQVGVVPAGSAIATPQLELLRDAE
jgi:hypothetical protein